MDAGYKTPWICKRIIDDGRLPSLPYKRPMTKEGFHEWYKYVYDEYLDIVICPEYKSLLYSTTNHKKESAYNVYIRCTPQTVKEPLLCKSVAEVLFKTFMS